MNGDTWNVVQLFALVVNCVYVLSDINPFMDSEWFAINWSPSTSQPQTVAPRHDIKNEDGTTVVMMTTNKEKYSCFVPSVSAQNEDPATAYSGPSAHELIEKLHTSSSCSYRIESYWTYELCHGKHLKQYHGDKDTEKVEGKMVFYLGWYKPKQYPEDSSESKTQEVPVIKTRKLENIQLPYYEVKMEDGTQCELTGAARRVSVLYVCQPDGRGEVYQLKEVATCQYEVIVLTSVLCPHPSYRPKQPTVNQIVCKGVNGAPLFPAKLIEYFPDTIQSQEQPQEIVPELRKVSKPTRPSRPPRRVPTNIGDTTDKHTLRSFFAGQNCIYGGKGWWRYEFCYGRHITQYHQDALGRTTLFLGKWDEAKHRMWVKGASPIKAAVGTQKQALQLFYGDGDYCAEAKQKRHTVVKILCQAQPTKPHSITLYLLEPKTCVYQLVVESKLFCGILDQADEDGVLMEPKL